MSIRLPVLVAVVVALTTAGLAACDSRTVAKGDASADATAVQRDSRASAPDAAPADSAPVDTAAPADAAVGCRSLRLVGSATLGQAPADFNDSASLAFDGKGFAVTWLARAPLAPSTSRRLLFSRLDLAAKPQLAQPVLLATISPSQPPQVVAWQGRYGVLYLTGAMATLMRLDAAGKILAKTPVHFGAAATAGVRAVATSAGFAALYTTSEPTLYLRRFDANAKGEMMATSVAHGGTSGSYWYLGLAARSGGAGGFVATWGANLQRIDAAGKLVGGAVEAFAKSATSGPSYALTPDGRAAVVYARSTDFWVEGLRLDASGKPLGSPLPIAQANIGSAPLQQLFLIAVGDGFALAYPGGGPGGRARVQLLDGKLAKVGTSVEPPACLSWAGGPVASAFGAGRLAVATVGGFSGPPGSAVCVAVYACR